MRAVLFVCFATLLVLLGAIVGFWLSGRKRSGSAAQQPNGSQRGTRQHVRYLPPSSSPIEIQLFGADFLEVLRVKDISLGGVGIYVKHGFSGLTVFEHVDVILSFPAGKSVRAKAQIRHKNQDSSSCFFGVEFVDLSESDRELIARYLKGLPRSAMQFDPRDTSAAPRDTRA